MSTSQSERLQRGVEFVLSQYHRRMNQLETMIAEFDRECIDLEHEIKADETHSRISDPAHFAYPTFAKTARARRAKLQQSSDVLRIELEKLKIEARKDTDRQIAA